MANNYFKFDGPVTINVFAPTAEAAKDAVELVRTQPAAPEAAIRFDPDYKSRKGYDPDFLDEDGGFTVPVPKVAPNRLDEIYKGKNGKALYITS